MADLYLGLDSSTQSLTVLVIDAGAGEVIYSRSINFDQDLPQYGTANGVLPHPDPLVKHSPPLLWVAALDALFEAMRGDGVPLAEVRAASRPRRLHRRPRQPESR